MTVATTRTDTADRTTLGLWLSSDISDDPRRRAHARPVGRGARHLQEHVADASRRTVLWPPVVPVAEPAEALADELAAVVRHWLGLSDDQPLGSFDELFRRGRFRLKETDQLRPDRGGVEALIIPRPGGGFRIVVDPTPRQGWQAVAEADRQRVRDCRMRFRIAHELAHSFFYRQDPDVEPVRARRQDAAEERFADRFAASLLLPPAAVRQARPQAGSVFELSARYAVSAQVAARALAAHLEQLEGVALVLRDDDAFTTQWASCPETERRALLAAMSDEVVAGPDGRQLAYACAGGSTMLSATSR